MFKISAGKKAPAPPVEEEEPVVEEAPQVPVEPEPEEPVEPEPLEEVPGITLPKAMVVYMGSEFGPFECQNCCHFQEDGSCEIVEGPIDPAGCCNIFCPPDHEEMPEEDPEVAAAEDGTMPEATDVEPVDEEEPLEE